MLLCFIFPTAGLIENTQKYHEEYSMPSPVSSIATAVKAMHKCCGYDIVMCLGPVSLYVTFFLQQFDLFRFF
jgi:hypothetical protein